MHVIILTNSKLEVICVKSNYKTFSGGGAPQLNRRQEVRKPGGQACIKQDKFSLCAKKESQNSCKNNKKCYAGEMIHHYNNTLKRTYLPINLFTYLPYKKSAFTLAEGATHVAHSDNARRAAFTLAEVLITLGIIGVVAAMTIPAIVAKYQERAWLTAFKKTYSVLSQAYLRASQDYGTANTWCAAKNTDCGKIYFDILSQYLNISEDFGLGRWDLISKASYCDLDGRPMGITNIFTNDYYKFILSDGTIIGIKYDATLNSPLMHVDINGLKGPNQLGKDVFYLSLIRRGDSPVVGGYSMWWLGSSIYCTQTGTGGSWWRGGGCSLWIISTGNMDYLHRNLTLEEWKKAVRNQLLDLNKDSLD